MSFKCKSCGKAQEAGTKPHKVTVETRNVHYAPIRDGEGIRIPVGSEIAREINVCPICFTTKDFDCIVVNNKVLG